MLNFTCEVNESYTFHTTSVIKLMKFLYRNDRSSEFLITVAADKNNDFIEKLLIPTDLWERSMIVSEKTREIKIKFHNPAESEAEFKSSVNFLIHNIVIMCIFSHDTDMFYNIDRHIIAFELNQSMVYDWNFSLSSNVPSRNDEGEESEVSVNSATTSILQNRNWFISMTIFCYITARPLVVSSSDCIYQYKPSPLPEN